MRDAPHATVILVIDDEPEVRRVFARILEAEGYVAIEAADGEAALSMIRHGLVPTGVLLDLHMPGMGGLAFLVQLRANPGTAALPVAVVTADSFINHAAEFAVKALRATLSFKPVTADEILALAAVMVHPSLR